MSKTIPAAADARITIGQVGADLQVRGWARNEVQVDGDLPAMRSEAEGKQITITASGDCELYVPENAHLEIGQVGADVKLADLRGEITIAQVGADLALRDCGPVTIGRVGADVRIRQGRGSVKIDAIGADLTLHEIEGNVTIGRVGADAYLREINGDCAVERVGADLILDIAFSAGHNYRFAAVSDVVCRVAPDADVQFVVPANNILRVNAVNAAGSQSESEQRVVIGAGAATVYLSSESGVQIVNDRGFDFGMNFDWMLDWGFDRAFDQPGRMAERIGEKIRRQAERAAEHAHRQAERDMERARRDAERAQRNAERQAKRGFGFDWQWNGWPPAPPHPPEPPRPPSEPVSDTERLTILRMVEAKQITVEEAERLLAALEGRA